MNVVRTLRALVLGGNLAAIGGLSASAAVVFTDRSEFQGFVDSGSYTETFDSLALGLNSEPLNFSQGGFTYVLDIVDNNEGFGFYVDTTSGDDRFLTTYDVGLPTLAIRATFTSGNVTAISGDFFASNTDGATQGATFTITLSDGTSQQFTTSAGTEQFVGFTSDVPITSLTFGNIMAGATDALSPSLDNFQVGVAVPELSHTMAAAAIGLLGFGVLRRARARRAA